MEKASPLAFAAAGQSGETGLLSAFRQQLEHCQYSPRTVVAYVSKVKRLLERFPHRHPLEISVPEIQEFLQELGAASSRASLDQAINAIRLFYERLYRRPVALESTPRPARQPAAPEILTREEILALIRAISNGRHRLMLELMYAGGLKASEVVRIRIQDIDLPGGTLWVPGEGGRPDRTTVLSPALSGALARQMEQKSPQAYLFAGHRAGKPMTTRAVEKVFKKAVLAAGIEKAVTPYSLRHSFAVHLLKSGTAMHHLQQVLGHAHLESTRSYARAEAAGPATLRSPL